MSHRGADLSIQDFPRIYPIQKQLRFLIRYAILAPSTRNTEPWRFTIETNQVRLRADLTRWQQVCDADRRELYLSLGCALENLLVAAEQVGFRYSVAYLPGQPDESVAAAVAFLPGGGRSPKRDALRLETIVARRTARGRYSDQAVSDDDRRALQRCASERGVSLTFVEEPAIKQAVEQLSTTAHEISFANPAFRHELAQWIGEGAFGTPWPLSQAGKLAVGQPMAARQLARLDALALESSPLLALISSAQDDRMAQIKSGQVLERLWLTATARGLGLQPLSVPLELPVLRNELTKVTGARLPWAQQLVRIGHPRHGNGHQTPRRPLDEVLDSPESAP